MIILDARPIDAANLKLRGLACARDQFRVNSRARIMPPTELSGAINMITLLESVIVNL